MPDHRHARHALSSRYSVADPVFDRLERSPAYRIVSDALQRAIVERRIQPGETLPIEGDLAGQFGVNRSTVREGIRNLEQAGFVQRRGKRLIVTRPSYQALGDQVSTALTLHDVTFLELWQTTMALETLAVELATEHVTPELADRLRDNLEATRRALDNGDDLVELDVAFHDLIAQAAGNRALLMAREPLARLFYPAFSASMFPANAGRRMSEAHGLILEAMLAGDTATAREWMTKHIVDFKRGYEMADLDINGPAHLSREPRR